MSKICPNYGGCRLVKTEAVEPDDAKREQYLAEYCTADENWKNCVRYTTRRSLWICPDFVLPDSEMTEEEIYELYEKNGKKEY
jgi:hypothetical protein